MMCNEMRYLDVASVYVRGRIARARAMETFAISLDTLVGRN